MVGVVNVRNYRPKEGEVLIKANLRFLIDNSFIMYNEGMRDEVCDKFETYFYKKVKEPGAFRDYVAYIYRTALKHDVALGCWCAPKRCHADTIAVFINQFLSK